MSVPGSRACKQQSKTPLPQRGRCCRRFRRQWWHLRRAPLLQRLAVNSNERQPHSIALVETSSMAEDYRWPGMTIGRIDSGRGHADQAPWPALDLSAHSTAEAEVLVPQPGADGVLSGQCNPAWGEGDGLVSSPSPDSPLSFAEASPARLRGSKRGRGRTYFNSSRSISSAESSPQAGAGRAAAPFGGLAPQLHAQPALGRAAAAGGAGAAQRARRCCRRRPHRTHAREQPSRECAPDERRGVADDVVLCADTAAPAPRGRNGELGHARRGVRPEEHARVAVCIRADAHLPGGSLLPPARRRDRRGADAQGRRWDAQAHVVCAGSAAPRCPSMPSRRGGCWRVRRRAGMAAA